MKNIQQFIISDDPYGNKLYEVFIMPCGLSVSSYVLGRHLTPEEIQNDELLMHMISRFLEMNQIDRTW